MISKRIFGFIFILLASILTLAIFGQLPALFGAIFGFFKIFTGKLDIAQAGEKSGHLFYWIIHFIATIALWKYGVKWSKTDRSLRHLVNIKHSYYDRQFFKPI